MTDATQYAYLCNQLQAALSDAPGGEKAWVPLRRSTVLACITALESAGNAVALMDELRDLLNRAQWSVETAQEVHAAPEFVGQPDAARIIEPACNCAACKELESVVYLRESATLTPVGVTDRDEWNALTQFERVALIRRALNGERVGWLPNRRAWMRHYPAAFVTNSNGAAHA